MENIYELTGVDCASCAEKIAKRLKRLPHVENVEYSLGTGKYKIISTKKILLDEVQTVVQGVEPNVKVADVSADSNMSYQDEQTIHHAHSHMNTDSQIGQFLQNNLVSRIIMTSIGLLLLLFLKPIGLVAFITYFMLYLFIGSDVVYAALRNIIHGEWFDESFLMSIATVGAFAIGEYPEAVVVMLFYQIGEYFQDKAVENSRKSIADLMDIRPDYANLVNGAKTERVSPYEVEIHDLILIKAGERIPLDGTVIAGDSYLDTSALTGEAVPRHVVVGDEVLSGAINQNGLLTVRVNKPFGESTVSKILNLVENASTKKAPTEKFITKFSHYYTPIVVFAAIILAFVPPLLLGFDTFYIWLKRALTFLVISCPCALAISVPLGFFGGLGLASKNGILIKGGNFLEALTSLETAVFDKTGTLTKGQFAITKVEVQPGFTKDEVLEYATYGEWFSAHPIAMAIKNEGVRIDERMIGNYQEIPGQGITFTLTGKRVLIGNDKLLKDNHIAFEQPYKAGTFVYVAVDQTFAGTIIIADALKTDARATIMGLHERNIATIMLTGDNAATAAIVAKSLGIDQYHAELLPQGKVAEFEKVLATKKRNTMFVGDGINDAPVLALADLGVSMGNIGSDAAIEASDIVLMSGDPAKILTAIDISQRTKKIVWENIIFAITVKIIVLILGAFGYASMWAAVFADIGVSLLAILNSIRIIYMDVK